MKVAMIFGTLLLLTLSLFPGCVYVGTPQITAFQNYPETISSGEVTNLIWAVVGADSVRITPELGSVPLAGSRQISPNETTTYILTARNAIGTTSSSLTVTVKPKANIMSFTANPTKISGGSSSTLQWNVTGTSSVSIYPEIGDVAPVGSYTVSPSSTMTYTLTAVLGTQVVTQSVTIEVTVPPVVASFSAFPEQVVEGRTTLLRWSVKGANKIKIEPDIGDVPASGSYALIPHKTTTYVLTAQSDCCVVSRSVVVNVIGFLTPTQFGPVVELFNVTPNSIYRGNSAILEWRVLNARSVTIDHGIGPVPSYGTITVSPSASTTYTLTVANEFAFYPVTVRLLVYD